MTSPRPVVADADRVRDDLPVNFPYDAPIAEAYDVWMPPEGIYDDRELYRRLIVAGDGPALELGCGTGRLLVGYLQDGLAVEGVDSSDAMLEHCRRHLAAAGITPVLHHADWTTLDLGRAYATLYNPSASFALMDDPAEARRALQAWRAHVRPGGRLVVSMGDLGPPGDWTWKVRRSGTRATDGVTFVVHEAIGPEPEPGVQVNLHRHEVWNPDGSLRSSTLRRHRLRSWTREDLAGALRDAGFSDVETPGEEGAYLAIGVAP